MMARQLAGATRQQEAARRDDKRTRGWCGAQREDEEERRCDNKLARQVDKRVAQREDGEGQCDNQLARQDNERAVQ
jgi:hypothetical protein